MMMNHGREWGCVFSDEPILVKWWMVGEIILSLCCFGHLDAECIFKAITDANDDNVAMMMMMMMRMTMTMTMTMTMWQ